jgi:hypothetical protein
MRDSVGKMVQLLNSRIAIAIGKVNKKNNANINHQSKCLKSCKKLLV